MRQFTILSMVAAFAVAGCSKPTEVQSASGVQIATVGQIPLSAEGQTVEQKNIIDRIKADNDPGSLKHLYVISAYSGQTILYSPVRGKVTSGGKRLTPARIEGSVDTTDLPSLKIAGHRYYVSDLPSEDGTYGSTSADYLFWFTPDGRYHQHYLSGGQIVHVSDSPMSVKGVIITVESK